MKRVPTRAPSAPAASAAATPRAVAMPPAATTGTRHGVQHAVEQREQGRALDPLATAGFPGLGDHDIAPSRLSGASLVDRLDLPPAVRAAGVDTLHELMIRIGEEEVDVRRLIDRQLQRIQVHERDDEVDAERRLGSDQRFEYGRQRRRRQRQPGIHPRARRPHATANGRRADAETLPIGASWIGKSQSRTRHSRSLIARL